MTKSERKGCNGQEVAASPSNATRSVTLERELRAAQSEAQAANGRVDEIRQSTERQLNKLRAEGGAGAYEPGPAPSVRPSTRRRGRWRPRLTWLASERAARAALDAIVAELQDSLKRALAWGNSMLVNWRAF